MSPMHPNRSRGRSKSVPNQKEPRDQNVTTDLFRVDGNVAGPITIVAGDGELELNNNNGKTLPAGVSPVCFMCDPCRRKRQGSVWTFLRSCPSSTRAAFTKRRIRAWMDHLPIQEKVQELSGGLCKFRIQIGRAHV